MKVNNVAVTVAIIIAVAALGVGVGYGIGTSVPSGSSVTVTSSPSTNSSSPYVVTLVVTTGNIFNSTIGEQPAFYVIGSHGLEPATSISFPAHRLIKLVIICYDTGAANLTDSKYAKVTGTQNNSVNVVSNSNVNSSQGAAGIQVNGGEDVSSMNASDIAHTFTIPQLGINIPIPPASTVTAYFTINQTGTFTWFCETACGSGPRGVLGAMATPGWMAGNVAAS